VDIRTKIQKGSGNRIIESAVG